MKELLVYIPKMRSFSTLQIFREKQSQDLFRTHSQDSWLKTLMYNVIELSTQIILEMTNSKPWWWRRLRTNSRPWSYIWSSLQNLAGSIILKLGEGHFEGQYIARQGRDAGWRTTSLQRVAGRWRALWGSWCGRWGQAAASTIRTNTENTEFENIE